MRRWVVAAACAAMLAGCGTQVNGVRAHATGKTEPRAQAAARPVDIELSPELVGNASGALAEGRQGVLPNAPSFDMDPFRRASGLVDGFSPYDGGYGAQLVPNDTQFKADVIARGWSADSKQVYIGWGFWKTSLLAQTQHFYYSPSKKKKLIITFKLVSWSQSTQEEDAPNFDLAYKILKGAADMHSWDARRAHSIARKAGYTPTGRNEVGVLIHPIVLGPYWVWLDNEDHQYPLLAVKAHSGSVVRDGLEMMAIRYMFSNQ